MCYDARRNVTVVSGGWEYWGSRDDTWELSIHDGTCVRDPIWRCDGDVDGSGSVNPVDLGLVQAAFCAADDCSEDNLCQYDLDCNGVINPVDAGIVQSLFGACDPPRDVCP
jgi:hypothetical protein